MKWNEMKWNEMKWNEMKRKKTPDFEKKLDPFSAESFTAESAKSYMDYNRVKVRFFLKKNFGRFSSADRVGSVICLLL